MAMTDKYLRPNGIKALREALGWSRTRLACESMMDSATIGRIESGRLIPYDEQLKKMARALGYGDNPEALMEPVEA